MSGGEPSLPRPTPQDEDQYLQSLAAEDPAVVAQAVRSALAAGRPLLAARVVGLLGKEEGEDADLDKARRAARFLVMQGGPPAQLEEQLEVLLEQIRVRRMQLARRRQRDKLRGHPRDPSLRRPRK